MGSTEVHREAKAGAWLINRPGQTYRQRVEAAGQRRDERLAARSVDRTIVWNDGRVERCAEINQAGPSRSMRRQVVPR